MTESDMVVTVAGRTEVQAQEAWCSTLKGIAIIEFSLRSVDVSAEQERRVVLNYNGVIGGIR
jgi:hypothetical protein